MPHHFDPKILEVFKNAHKQFEGYTKAIRIDLVYFNVVPPIISATPPLCIEERVKDILWKGEAEKGHII